MIENFPMCSFPKMERHIFHNLVLDILVVSKTLAKSNALDFVGKMSGQNTSIKKSDMTASTYWCGCFYKEGHRMCYDTTPMPYPGPCSWERTGIVDNSVTMLGQAQHLDLLPLSSTFYSLMTKVNE